MHGDICFPKIAVLTKDNYKLYNETYLLFTIALKGKGFQKHFFL
ncbi:hypothetical protein P787_0662 [Enterococcus faecalis MN16]|nr:hypothetical protein P787_0662 [Enterococcus faecalis MN16]